MATTIDDLKNRFPIWVNWRYEERTNSQGEIEKTKIPKIAGTSGTVNAKANDKRTWRTYAEAVADAEKKIGICFPEYDTLALCGIDIDADKTTHKICDEGEKALELFKGTYIEHSPSGYGYHILFYARWDDIPPAYIIKTDTQTNTEKRVRNTAYYEKRTDIGLECYIGGLTNRYFTFTDNLISECTEIADKSKELLIFLNKYMKKQSTGTSTDKPQKPPKVAGKVGRPAGKEARPYINPDADDIDDNVVFTRLAYVCTIFPDFADLFFKGKGSKGSQSELDASLCTQLCYYLNATSLLKNGAPESLIDYVFRRSALMRDKWDEDRGGCTYGELTIGKALEYEKKRIADGGKPFECEKPRLSIEVLDNLLKLEQGTNRLNLISHYPECTFEGKPTRIEHIVATLHSKYGNQMSNISQDTLYMYLSDIAYTNRYNPVLDYLRAEPADGKDYFPQLWKLLGIEDDELFSTSDDKLSMALIRKWLYQSIWLLKQDEEDDDPLDTSGILILNGEQGCGKTSFFKGLALKGKWFGEGISVDPSNKDTIIKAISHWVTELGEIESTFKSDIEKLKNFLTSAVDELRMPYGRATHKYPRRTSLCGTCNTDRYLVDPTGNRRYWTIKLTRTIPHSEIEKFPFIQLWRQVLKEAEEQGNKCFRLTHDEEQVLASRNKAFEKLLKGEQEVVDILTEAEVHSDQYKNIEVSIAEWMTYHSTIFRGLSADQIAKAVRKQGVEGKHTRKGNVYNLPIHKGSLPITVHVHSKD